MKKNPLFLGLLIMSALMFSCVDGNIPGPDPGEVAGDGTPINPYSVYEAAQKIGEEHKWIWGVVLDGNASYILLGKDKNATESESIMIMLNVDDTRDALNVATNPGLIGTGVVIYCTIIERGTEGVSGDVLVGAKNVYAYNLNYVYDTKASISLKFPDEVLKTAAKFPVGTATEYNQFTYDPSALQIVKRDISSLTSVYKMKMDFIWKDRDTYYFDEADDLVNFAKKNGIRMHGHTLVWSEVLPDWFKELEKDQVNWYNGSQNWTDLMVEYITTVMTHFKGRVASWDVVNEAFNEDGTLRGDPYASYNSNTFWYDKVGPDWILKAFEAARAADPDCKLFYNDYGVVYNVMNWSTTKGEGIYAYFRDVLVPAGNIDGIGLQCHLGTYVDRVKAKTAFTNFADLGLLIHVSELDMMINNNALSWNPNIGNGYVIQDPLYDDPYFDIFDYAQGKSFNMLVRAYLEAVPPAQRHGITMWGGLTDYGAMNHGNKNIYGNEDWPNMFGYSYQPKRAYHAVLEGLLGVDWEAEEKLDWNWRKNQGYE